MSKQKVCILQNGLARGGTDTFVVNLCRSLNHEIYDITVVNPSSKLTSRVRESELLAAGATIIHTNDLGRGIISIIRHLYKLFFVLRKGKYDIFQTNVDLFNGPNLFVAWLARVPIRCCHSHNTMQQKEIIKGRTIGIMVYQKIMRWLCWHFSNRRTGCSEDAMDFLFKGYPWRGEEYPTIIKNGIDIDSFRGTYDANCIKAALGIKSRFLIVTVGHLIPQKNPIFAADVFCKLCQIRNDCEWLVIGDGELEDQCKSVINNHRLQNKAHFIGVREDVNVLLSCCDILFLPSIFEGLGIVSIEAQAAGVRCLISDGFPKEVDCGGCVFLRTSDTATKWAEVLSDMLDNKIHLQIDENRVQDYSLKNLSDQMSKVFSYEKIRIC